MNRSRLEQRWSELVQTLNPPRPMCPGSICQQRLKKRRADGSLRVNGPYLLYTRKDKGKTVSRRVDAEQAERYRLQIESFRQFRACVTELQGVGLQLADVHEESSSKKNSAKSSRRKGTARRRGS